MDVKQEDLCRVAFEINHLENNKNLCRRNEHGVYVSPPIQDAWAGWQTCWEWYQERLSPVSRKV